MSIYKQKLKNNQKLKITLIFAFCVIAIIAGYVVFVRAEFFTDSFTTEDDVADTWQTTVATSTGQVTLELRDCDAGAAVWFCNASTTCENYAGDGDYILVAQGDLGTTKQWKTANTACDMPECGIDGGQYGDNLVADNTVNFGVYPARDACKAIGGRLPTQAELQCIYNNKVDTFGNNFGTGYYWSSTENSLSYARVVSFSTGVAYAYTKTGYYSVRCVRGW